jgi:hypothetical protein
MSASIELRALVACQKYVAVQGLIRSLTRQIGDALDACPGTNSERPSEESYKPTHLSDFYRRGDIAGEWGFMGYNGPDYLAIFKACPHCVLAHQLIQQRKDARQSFGAAKRQITRLGKLQRVPA